MWFYSLEYNQAFHVTQDFSGAKRYFIAGEACTSDAQQSGSFADTILSDLLCIPCIPVLCAALGCSQLWGTYHGLKPRSDSSTKAAYGQVAASLCQPTPTVTSPPGHATEKRLDSTQAPIS